MKTLTLVGGGHAHLHCLEQLKKEQQKDWRVVLISPSRHQYYSGMFSGYAEGIYRLDDIRIDLQKLCEQAGAIFIKDRIAGVDGHNKRLAGTKGVYPFDVASFDIGSQNDIPAELAERVSKIKPNYRFPEALLKFRETAYPVIAGGGASGVEMAFAVLAWRKKNGLPPNVSLFSSSSLLSGQGATAVQKIEAIARQKALPFFTDERIAAIDEHSVSTQSGRTSPQSDLLCLTGPKSPGFFKHSGLKTDAGGFLLVNESLQSLSHSDLFGAGDCIAIDRYPALAKNGVYAVRQGSVLWNNLKNQLGGKQLAAFTPQKNFLSILSTGGSEAFLMYGKQAVHGKLPWLLKQRIDQKFMQRFKTLYE
ncbi:FAD-dependent oxidoreductase [Planococcus sp. N064]|uniref:FAD-dependent oxidoreductase n=1 Tax=Planococcus liqunii TaxID=3058394 RepID=A0ABT8MUA8_9BACL|nr:FAD-dependent oxidoreductase [Planococcus sp. N064]MDN7228498.1 FAD-dependent oxidoreductase [Planococcus sp. N064]